VVPSDADQLVFERRDQREAIPIVHRREAANLGVGQPRVGAEEAAIDRLRREPSMERNEGTGVVGSNGPDVYGRPVRQEGVELPPCRVWLGAARTGHRRHVRAERGPPAAQVVLLDRPSPPTRRPVTVLGEMRTRWGWSPFAHGT